jgi:hypothetical protein
MVYCMKQYQNFFLQNQKKNHESLIKSSGSFDTDTPKCEVMGNYCTSTFACDESYQFTKLDASLYFTFSTYNFFQC